MYRLELVSDDGRFTGVKYVNGEDFDRAKKGQVFEEFSVVTNAKGVVRFSEQLEKEDTLKDIRNEALKITIYTFYRYSFNGYLECF